MIFSSPFKEKPLPRRNGRSLLNPPRYFQYLCRRVETNLHDFSYEAFSKNHAMMLCMVLLRTPPLIRAAKLRFAGNLKKTNGLGAKMLFSLRLGGVETRTAHSSSRGGKNAVCCFVSLSCAIYFARVCSKAFKKPL